VNLRFRVKLSGFHIGRR